MEKEQTPIRFVCSFPFFAYSMRFSGFSDIRAVRIHSSHPVGRSAVLLKRVLHAVEPNAKACGSISVFHLLQQAVDDEDFAFKVLRCLIVLHRGSSFS